MQQQSLAAGYFQSTDKYSTVSNTLNKIDNSLTCLVILRFWKVSPKLSGEIDYILILIILSQNLSGSIVTQTGDDIFSIVRSM